jgi:glycosyltransferase involved in cell wall biosynthesis
MSIAIALIPVYNAGSYLRPCVESLVNQSRALDGIIIIDDGSTDSSIETIRDFESQGLVEIRINSKNLGRAESINRLFKEITADYFILQDADDVALPKRIEKQIHFMDSNPEIGCSSCFIEYINSEGRFIGNGVLDLTSKDKFNQYISDCEPFGLFCPGVILRTSVVKTGNLGFRGQYWPADDVDLWNRIAESGWLVLAQPEFLVQYRIHSSSAVTSSYVRTRMKFEWLRSCLKARRSGQREPSYELFLKDWNSKPLMTKLNRWRKIRAKALYRGAGFAMAEGKKSYAGIQLLLGCALQPSYVLSRGISYLRRAVS